MKTAFRTLLSPKLMAVIGGVIMIGLFIGMAIPNQYNILLDTKYAWYTKASSVLSLLALLSLYGYWHMKRWGVYLYMAISATSIVYWHSVGIGFTFGYYIIFAILSIGVINWKIMS